MVTLVIEGAGGSQLAYQLDKPSISVGASSHNDVVLRTPGVAPKHLVIQRNGDVFTFLSQPRQVVVLNGERRARGVLKIGDKIRIGSATIVFNVESESETDVEVVNGADDSSETVPSAGDPPPKRAGGRSEVVLYREPHRLGDARQQLVDLFRSRMRSDLVPSLRALWAQFFPERKALLAVVDDEGRFQPLVSQWEGDFLRLPAQTFEELSEVGRYAELRIAGQILLINPVDRGPEQSKAYLVVETNPEDKDEDRGFLGELARFLAVHWDRFERSTSLYGEWVQEAQQILETNLPGTSQAVRILRDDSAAAARSGSPVMLCGRGGSGRMFLANLIASLRPSGKPPVKVFQARAGDDASLHVDLFGANRNEEVDSLVERSRGSVVVVRDIHLATPRLQREVAAAVNEDVESAYGPSVRWMVTTAEDATAMLNEGVLDVTLFRLFDRHVIRIPSLVDRREDLPLLIVRLLERVGAEQGKEIRGIELETLNSILDYSFDGQMTELLGEVRRLASATADGEMVRGLVPRQARAAQRTTADDEESIYSSMVNSDDLKQVIPSVERLVIDRVLKKVQGNQSKGARTLNLSRGALISKIKDYDIPDYRSLRRKG